MKSPRFLEVCALLAAVTLGCSSGEAPPLTPAAVDQALAVPAGEALRVQAREIRHPLLRPIALEGLSDLTPDQAALLAVLINPTLRAARAERGVAQAQLLQAGLLPNPTVGGSIEHPYFGPDQFLGWGAEVSWDIASLFALQAKKESAQSHVDSVDLDVAWQEWQIAQAARLAAYRRISLEKQLAVAGDIDLRLKENLELVRKAFDAHQKTEIDLAAAEAASQEAHETVLETQRDLHKQKVALTKAMGLPASAEVSLSQEAPPAWEGEAPSYEGLTAGMEDRRLDLLALRRGYESQSATLRAAVLSRFPKIELGVAHNRDTSDNRTFGPTVSVELPIFNQNQGGIAIEKATGRKLFDEYVGRVFEARAEVAELLADIRSLGAQIDAAQKSLPVLERLVRTYEKAMAAGNADILSYYAARNDLGKKAIDVLKLRQELVETFLALEIASGKYLSHPEDQSASQPAPRPTTTSSPAQP